MELKKVLLASSAALALTAASATAQAGNYITVFGGANFQSDVDAHASYTGTFGGLTGKYGLGYYHMSKYVGFDVSAEHDTGFVVGAAFGKDLNEHWRMELELAYRENQVDDRANVRGSYSKYITGSAVTGYVIGPSSTVIPIKGPITGGYGPNSFGSYTMRVDGSTSFFSVMANVWYDFNIVDNWETFVGVGLGVAQANVNSLQFGTGSGYMDVADGSDWVFAYQFGVGAGYTIDNGVTFSAQYRYFGTDDVDIEGVHLEGEASSFLFGVSFPLGN